MLARDIYEKKEYVDIIRYIIHRRVKLIEFQRQDYLMEYHIYLIPELVCCSLLVQQYLYVTVPQQ